jgi:cyclophilin family peptidyl-prolyl cis-trans isomerase
MPQRKAFAALALALAAVLGGERAFLSAEPAPEAVPAVEGDIPSGMPIALDGAVIPGEWSDAPPRALSREGPFLRLKHVRGTLLLSLTTDRPWPRNGRLLLWARAGSGPGAGTDPGTVVVDYEPFEHHRPHAVMRVRGATTWEAREGAAVFRAARLAEAASVEGAILLSALGVVDPANPASPPKPLRWVAQWLRPGQEPSHLTVPTGLDLGAVREGAPPDLATTKRWALASTWKDAGGPGAFSKTEWTAWTAADKELADRGARAHALSVPLRDGAPEPERGGDPKAGKVDQAIDEDLVGALRSIGAREPLTATDLRAIAIGLWRTNRFAEALATLEALRLSPLGADDAEALYLTGMIAYDAERFDESEKAFDVLSARLGDKLGGGYRALAARSRSHAERFATEVAARREDAAKGDLPIAHLETSKGDVFLLLHEDDVPEAVKNFVHLVEAGKDIDGKPFYPGSLFHRVVASGVVQGGDPKSRNEGCAAAGTGGSTWWIAPEPNPRHAFFRGSVGWAVDEETGNRIRGQFFVTTAPRPTLTEGRPTSYPCFATVIAGMDVVDRLEACDVLRSVRILRKRPGTTYEPKKRY